MPASERQDQVRSAVDARQSLFDFLIHVGDVERGSDAGGLEKKPCLINGISERVDVTECAPPRISVFEFGQGGAFSKREVHLIWQHGAALLFWVREHMPSSAGGLAR